MGQDKLNEDQYLDMDKVQSQVDITCEQVAELSPEDASEVREPLSQLLDDLKTYACLVDEVEREENNYPAPSGQ